ncbi:MAG: histidine-type phosphatase [Prevotella sp.]
MQKRFFILGLLAILLPGSLLAQKQRSQEFKNKYQLQEVVALSRHNIRAPLSTKGSLLEEVTTHQWNNWTAGASELTSRGGALENQFGLYFRKWAVDAGLFKENAEPSYDEVNIYANSMQRCIATARYFTTAFLPIADVRVNHRYTPSKMDPIFFPRLTKVSESFRKEAMKEIAAMGGKKGIVGINEGLKKAYDITANTLDLKESPACKKGEICAFDNYNTQIFLNRGEEPHMKGSLKQANTCSDAFILQYYEEPDAKKAAFGHDLTTDDWTQIAKIKDVYGDVLFAAPIVAVNVAHPLLTYMYDELNAKGRKFTFLCGHDSNICSVLNALGVEDYELPNSIEKKTPIGSKFVIEKFKGADGQMYCDLSLTYQSTDQLRSLSQLNLQNPPQIFPLSFKGLQRNADGLFKLSDVNAMFKKAIRAYDGIEDDNNIPDGK